MYADGEWAVEAVAYPRGYLEHRRKTPIGIQVLWSLRCRLDVPSRRQRSELVKAARYE